ncbi:MAG: uroporphyrinogen-III synthase [Saccharospirillum sp.]
MKLLLPKPEADWPRWRQCFSGSDHTLLWLDPWRFDVFPETPERRTVWLDLDQFTGVICVSPFAARLLIQSLDQYWPMAPVGVQWWCNGPGTASVLEAEGLKAQYPDSEHTAEAVLAALAHHTLANSKWLILQGEGGRECYPAALRERGAEVRVLTLYRRSISAQAMADLVEQSRQADALLVSSVTLLDAMMAAQPDYWRRWAGCWLFSSQRVQRCARDWQLPDGRLLRGASPQAVLEAL